MLFFFFKHKTAYEMRISDWSSDVCSSDLERGWDEGAWRRAPSSALAGTFSRKREKGSSNLDHNRPMPTILVIDDNPSVATALDVLFSLHDIDTLREIGRASWRERVCPYV